MLFLEAGRIIVDNADMYRFVDDETEQQHGDSLAHGECSLAMRGLYFENGEHKVLLDPGPGSVRSRQALPAFGTLGRTRVGGVFWGSQLR